MSKVTYSLTLSLDGYVVGPDGRFDWAEPDDEAFAFATDEVRGLRAHLLGRRLYESMLYWETAEKDPAITQAELEFTRLWRPQASSTSTACGSCPSWSAAALATSPMTRAGRTSSSSTPGSSARR
jgi:hypothetical protein